MSSKSLLNKPAGDSNLRRPPTNDPPLHTTGDAFLSYFNYIGFEALHNNLTHLLAYPDCFDDLRNPQLNAAARFIADHILPLSRAANSREETYHMVVLPESMSEDVVSLLARFGSEYALPGRKRTYTSPVESQPQSSSEFSEVSSLDLNHAPELRITGNSKHFVENEVARDSPISFESGCDEQVAPDKTTGGGVKRSGSKRNSDALTEAGQNTAGVKQEEESSAYGPIVGSIDGHLLTEEALSAIGGKTLGNYRPPIIESIEDEDFRRTSKL
jgi:hypothetical protein